MFWLSIFLFWFFYSYRFIFVCNICTKFSLVRCVFNGHIVVWLSWIFVSVWYVFLSGYFIFPFDFYTDVHFWVATSSSTCRTFEFFCVASKTLFFVHLTTSCSWSIFIPKIMNEMSNLFITQSLFWITLGYFRLAMMTAFTGLR